MIYLVIAHSHAFFQRRIEAMLEKAVEIKRYGPDRFIIDGDTYIYMTSPERMRGFHGVKVVFWGPKPENYEEFLEVIPSIVQA